MGDRTLSYVAYEGVARAARAAGSTTYKGEQRQKEGKGLHPLVDPKGYDVIRRSISRKGQKGDLFELLLGIAMLDETRLDTTGSMGNNVDIAMRVLPTTYGLLASGEDAVLKRYDTQMITSIFGDVTDKYVLCRSQAEMDEKIAEQMTLMVPEGGGGDTPEDPQYGLFGAAFLTAAEITMYDLKSYDFTVSDAPGRDRLSRETLIRVFGESVFEKVAENGYTIDPKNLPDTKEVVAELSKHAHAFFLQVEGISTTRPFWTEIYGRDHVVTIPSTELLPHVKAAIIGLTEGVLDLRTVGEYLEKSGLNSLQAKSITRAVAGIPLRAQAELPNFDKIPLKGALFAKKGDVWPISGTHEGIVETGEASEDKIWA